MQEIRQLGAGYYYVERFPFLIGKVLTLDEDNIDFEKLDALLFPFLIGKVLTNNQYYKFHRSNLDRFHSLSVRYLHNLFGGFNMIRNLTFPFLIGKVLTPAFISHCNR